MKHITIEIEGGNITDVEGLPKGYEIKVVDRDLQKVGEKYIYTL